MKAFIAITLLSLPLLSSPAFAQDDPPAAEVEEELEGGRNDLGHGSCSAHEQAIRDHELCIQQARTRTDIRNCGPRPQLPARCG